MGPVVIRGLALSVTHALVDGAEHQSTISLTLPGCSDVQIQTQNVFIAEKKL